MATVQRRKGVSVEVKSVVTVAREGRGTSSANRDDELDLALASLL